jgi:hypothetical protein
VLGLQVGEADGERVGGAIRRGFGRNLVLRFGRLISLSPAAPQHRSTAHCALRLR